MKREELLEAVQLPGLDIVETSPEFGSFEEGDNTVVYHTRDDQQLFLNSDALADISSALGIPSPYIAKLPTSLAVTNLNYWFSTLGKSFKTVVNYDDQQVLAFTRANAAEMIDIDAALECIEDAIGPINTLDYWHPHASLDTVSFSVIGAQTVEPVPGDTFRSGLTFSYSPVDKAPMTIQGFNHRLVCANGMYAVDRTQMSRRHPADNVYEWIQANAAEVWANSFRQYEMLQHAHEVALPALNTGELIDHIYRNFAIPQAARAAVSDRILHEGAGNLYDLINHITFVATHDADLSGDFALQSRLFSQAGQIAEHAQLCPQCNRLL